MCWCGSAVLSRKGESGTQSCHRVQACAFTVCVSAEVSQGGSATCSVCVRVRLGCSKGAAKAKILHNARRRAEQL